MANQLQGPNYQIVGNMPLSLKNSQPGLAPVPNDRIRIYEIISTVSAGTWTLTDGAASNPSTELVVTAAGVWSFNPPLELADFQVLVTGATPAGSLFINTK